MNVLFSLRQKYASQIFSGNKPMEFRMSAVKVNPGDRCFVYETKGGKPKGCGKVTGYFLCGDEGVKEIPHHKVGTYAMLPAFIDHWFKHPDCVKISPRLISEGYNMEAYKKLKPVIEDAMSIKFPNHDSSYVLNFMCNPKAVEIMKKANDVLGLGDMMLLTKDINEYTRYHQFSMLLCSICDEWLKDIGYYSDDDRSYWSHYIPVKDPVLFDKPVDVTEFSLSCGRNEGQKLINPPQSFCYVNYECH